MENEEFIKELSKKYEQIINKRNDADYMLNQENWKKLLSVLDYLTNAAQRLGGKVEPVNLIPREKHGYIEAVFDIFDIYGDSVKDFAKAVEMVDVFSIEPLTTGEIRIGININSVYEKK